MLKLKEQLSTRGTYRATVGAFFFLQGLTFASWASRIPDIKSALALNDAQLGAVLCALPVGQMAAMGFSGYLISYFTSKRMLTIGILFYSAMLVLAGLANSIWTLGAALFFFGIFGNCCNLSVNTQAIGVERLYKRSIMASFHGLWSLAGFTGGLLSALMVWLDVAPWQHFLMIYFLAQTVLFFSHQYMLPRDSRRDMKNTPVFAKPDRMIFILGLIAFSCMICEGTMFDWSGVYFKDVVRASNDLKQFGYIAFMSTMALGRFISDRLVMRLGVKFVLRISGICMTTGLLLAVLFPNIIVATIGFLLVGFGTSSVVPLVYSLAGKSKHIRPSVALAMISSISFLGFLLGPPMIGFIAEAFSLRLSFSIIAIIGLMTAFLSGKTTAK